MIRLCDPVFPDVELVKQAIEEIWQTGQITNFGKYCCLFEEEVKKYTGAKYAVAVTNCDTALKMCVKAMDMGTVCLPTFTFNSTWMATTWNRSDGSFRLLDIADDTLLVDLNTIEDFARCGNKDFILVNVFGNIYDVDGLNTLRDKYGLNILFDSAHSFGSSYRGKKSGNLGYTECFSFSATKVITSGEGGVVCTEDEDLYNKLKYMRNYGFLGDYNSIYVGCNAKFNELNAVVGYHSMKIFEEVQARKKRIIDSLKEKLGKKYTFQKLTEGVDSCYKDFALLNVDYSTVSKALKEKDIQHKQYFLPLHRQDIVKKSLQEGSCFPNAEKVYNTSVCLPSHSKLTEEEVRIISETLNSL